MRFEDSGGRFGHFGGHEGFRHDFHSHADHHDHGGLGWGHAAWSEAGGFEHVLGGGHAEPSFAASHDTGLSNTTSTLFNTGAGGTIDVGGNVETFGAQTVDSSHDFGSFAHSAQIETTSIIFNVASGGTLDVGGNVEALSSQSSSGSSHDFGHVSDATSIIFNVASGGAINIGGSVEAAAQQSLLPHATADLAHA